ncbi:hypothetical protein BHE74_00037757, partial [Ensete ventricosum]
VEIANLAHKDKCKTRKRFKTMDLIGFYHLVSEPSSWRLAALPPSPLPSATPPSSVAVPTTTDLTTDSVVITLYRISIICCRYNNYNRI